MRSASCRRSRGRVEGRQQTDSESSGQGRRAAGAEPKPMVTRLDILPTVKPPLDRNQASGYQVLPVAPMKMTASAGPAIGTPSKLPSDSRSLSPETMSPTLAAMASASTSSPSGSRHTGCGSGGGAITSARRRSSANDCSREVSVRLRMASTLPRTTAVADRRALICRGNARALGQRCAAVDKRSPMGNYLFDPGVLRTLLDTAARRGEMDFGRHVLPRATRTHRVCAYDFSDSRVLGTLPHEEPRYWRDVGTIEAYRGPAGRAGAGAAVQPGQRVLAHRGPLAHGSGRCDSGVSGATPTSRSRLAGMAARCAAANGHRYTAGPRVGP